MTANWVANLWSFVHNVVAHPLLAFSFNSAWANRFHDWTAARMDT